MLMALLTSIGALLALFSYTSFKRDGFITKLTFILSVGLFWPVLIISILCPSGFIYFCKVVNRQLAKHYGMAPGTYWKLPDSSKAYKIIGYDKVDNFLVKSNETVVLASIGTIMDMQQITKEEYDLINIK
jgi:hypothetical protein